MATIPPPAPLEPGFRLDRYELLCKIGQGGMATVWVARTTNTHGEERLVAIKTILPSLTHNERLRTMLLDEARIAVAIEHPNVARTYEVGLLWDQPYLVLELIEGESVAELSKALTSDSRTNKTIPPAIVARIVSDAALGLHAAHELLGDDGENLGIVHRDVAPPNILVDEQGRARVIDFGVAKAVERYTPDTTAGVMKGRVPFMAPEHASGDAVDRRSDIWSLGVVAYVMLTNRFPFEAPNEAARLIRILGTDDPDPLPDDVPAALRDVILHALCKDPDDRYETAADLAEALKAAAPASHEETAKFVQATLAETIAARHQQLENALAAADGRAHARELLDKPPGPGTRLSYRPPSINASPSPPESESESPGGTLGSVTRGERAAHLPWRPWVTAGMIASIVLIAFALGSFNARAPATAAMLSATDAVPVPAPHPATFSAEPLPTGTVAEVRAKAEAEAAASKALADARSGADAGSALPAPKASATTAVAVKLPATPSASGAPSVSASAPKATAKKPLEPEDTIF